MSNEKALFRQERERLLLTGEIPRLFTKYALPGVAGLLFLGIQSVIDGIVLGRFVGANALASVNLILPCYSLISAFAIVMGIGGQTIGIPVSACHVFGGEPVDLFICGGDRFFPGGECRVARGCCRIHPGTGPFLPVFVCDVLRRLYH